MMSAFSQKDPVLMKIGDEDVHLSEFTYIYEKNNGEEANYAKASVEEYLNLFTNFKLKVKKAKEMRMDTIVALKNELAGYRKQLANSYLMEKELSHRLLQEMWKRRKQDVRVSHILFKLRTNPQPSEIESAKKRAFDVKALIDEGKTFASSTSEFSEDPNSKDQGGDLGYITSWLPSGFYELENAAYDLSIGEVSDPIITKLGVHIVKVVDKRPAFGKIEVAHILLRTDIGTEEDVAKAKIEEISAKLKNGENFNELAKAYSEDKSSAQKGGRLNVFGINTFDRAFEKAAFALENDGDLSPPVKTRIGWHLIKRISKPVETEEEFKKRMKSVLPKLDRYEMIKDILVDEIKKETGFKEDKELLSNFSSNLDEKFLSYKWDIPSSVGEQTLMSLGKENSYSLKDFATHAKNNTRLRMRYNKEKSPTEAAIAIYKAYVKEKALEYEEKNLENKYPDFKSLMREYSEGILLFEVSKMMVWDKASRDTVGLKAFFKNNKSNYFFTPVAEVASMKISQRFRGKAEEIYEYAKTHSVEECLDKYNAVETMIVAEIRNRDQNDSSLGEIEWEVGALGKIDFNSANRAITIHKIIKVSPLEYKTLDDSRGYVIADYQQHLESKWVASLHSEYKVEIIQDVLANIIK